MSARRGRGRALAARGVISGYYRVGAAAAPARKISDYFRPASSVPSGYKRQRSQAVLAPAAASVLGKRGAGVELSHAKRAKILNRQMIRYLTDPARKYVSVKERARQAERRIRIAAVNAQQRMRMRRRQNQDDAIRRAQFSREFQRVLQENAPPVVRRQRLSEQLLSMRK